MSKLIQVIRVNENTIDMKVAAAFITFALNCENVVGIVQIPPPNECYVPQNLMWSAKKQAKAILLEKKNKDKKTRS